MSTQKNLVENSKEFSISLTFKNKQNYLFTLNSLYNLCKSSLILSLENPELQEHNHWDIYNTIELLRLLCMNEEIS